MMLCLAPAWKLPTVTTAGLACGVLLFLYASFWAVVLMSSGDKRPITSSLTNLSGQYFTDNNLIAADEECLTKVLVLTTFDLDEYAFAGLRAGASGFLLKDVPPGDLLTGIRAVAAGDAVVAPSVTRRLLDTFAHKLPLPASTRAERVAPLADLTARELEVLTELARGHSNAEIAAQLVLSEATVKSHVGHILAKLGLRDRVQVVVFAYETGLVQPSLP